MKDLREKPPVKQYLEEKERLSKVTFRIDSTGNGYYIDGSNDQKLKDFINGKFRKNISSALI
jgi:hypothetical protein